VKESARGFRAVPICEKEKKLGRRTPKKLAIILTTEGPLRLARPERRNPWQLENCPNGGEGSARPWGRNEMKPPSVAPGQETQEKQKLGDHQFPRTDRLTALGAQKKKGRINHAKRDHKTGEGENQGCGGPGQF